MLNMLRIICNPILISDGIIEKYLERAHSALFMRVWIHVDQGSAY